MAVSPEWSSGLNLSPRPGQPRPPWGCPRSSSFTRNLLDVAFADYDAFYLFNPFEENMHGHIIDSAIPLSADLFKKYTRHVAHQLGERPLGTRVVTYAGYADDIPSCYDCEKALFRDELKLWIKNREYDHDIECLGLRVSRSYRGAAGWASRNG